MPRVIRDEVDRATEPELKLPDDFRLSVVVPVFNEAKTIESVMRTEMTPGASRRACAALGVL